jgi:hypothetical protein
MAASKPMITITVSLQFDKRFWPEVSRGPWWMWCRASRIGQSINNADMTRLRNEEISLFRQWKAAKTKRARDEPLLLLAQHLQAFPVDVAPHSPEDDQDGDA